MVVVLCVVLFMFDEVVSVLWLIVDSVMKYVVF